LMYPSGVVFERSEPPLLCVRPPIFVSIGIPRGVCFVLRNPPGLHACRIALERRKFNRRTFPLLLSRLLCYLTKSSTQPNPVKVFPLIPCGGTICWRCSALYVIEIFTPLAPLFPACLFDDKKCRRSYTPANLRFYCFIQQTFWRRAILRTVIWNKSLRPRDAPPTPVNLSGVSSRANVPFCSKSPSLRMVRVICPVFRLRTPFLVALTLFPPASLSRLS